jgi:hypothetical protein
LIFWRALAGHPIGKIGMRGKPVRPQMAGFA